MSVYSPAEDLEGAVSNHPNRSKTNRGAGSNPKPAEILRAREAAGLTQDQAGALLYSGWRTWHNWENEGGPESRRMRPSDWELFNVKVRARKLLAEGEISAETLKTLGLYLPPLE
ncbi:MAG TPA: hypothetical protein VE008_07445 [Burkholderiales bacterium]|nr:hypothetical protein [Burkholderiales bacterium]